MAEQLDFIPMSTLRQLDWPKRASLLVRHAERHPIHSAFNNHHIGLTEKGMLDAQEFGKHLSRYRAIRLYHSPAKRCGETAQAIAIGAKLTGVHIVTIEEDRRLSGATLVLDDRCLHIADRMGYDFIREWFSGKIDPALIKSLSTASYEMSEHLVQRMTEDRSQRMLDINISHDWNVLALRENYLRLRHEEIGWVGFLDGLTFYPLDDDIAIAYGPASRPLHRVRLEHHSGIAESKGEV